MRQASVGAEDLFISLSIRLCQGTRFAVEGVNIDALLFSSPLRYMPWVNYSIDIDRNSSATKQIFSP